MAKILIIDRSAPIRKLITKILTERGHKVFEAADGMNGLLFFRHQKPDVTILSRGTYFMRGSQVLSEIKKLDPSAQVIILTRLFDEEGKKRYAEMGASDFLSKEVLLGRLVEEIEARLKQKDAPPSPEPPK